MTKDVLIVEIRRVRYAKSVFGCKSEKLAPFNPNQLGLFGGLVPENASEIMEAREKAVESIKKTVEDRKRGRKSRKMMKNLPALEQVVIEPEGIDLKPVQENRRRVILGQISCH